MEELSKKLKELMGEEVLSNEIKKRKNQFSGLITEEDILKLIAREKGISFPETDLVLPKKLVELKQGEYSNVLVRVLHVFSPKAFEKEERKGRVCNMLVSDETGKATMVLWNRDVDFIEKGIIERNSVIEAKNVFVKNAAPLELHSGMLTEIHVKEDSFEEIPKDERIVFEIAGLKQGMMDVDFYGRVLDLREEKTFVKEKRTDDSMVPVMKKGLVSNCLVSDGTGQIRLILWDKNAEMVRKLKIGDAIKVESGFVKANPQTNSIEVHVGWKGRLVPNPRNHGLKEREKIIESTYQKKKMLEMLEGETAIANITLLDIYSARLLYKCNKCGATVKPQEGNALTCECGSSDIREIPMVTCEITDESAAMKCIFYGKQALELLEARDSGIGLDTILQLKKEYIIGKKFQLLVYPKKNAISGELELVVKHIISKT